MLFTVEAAFSFAVGHHSMELFLIVEPIKYHKGALTVGLDITEMIFGEEMNSVPLFK